MLVSVSVVWLWLAAPDGLSQSRRQPPDGPELRRIEPATAAPLTDVQIHGLRIGAHKDEGVRILFLQDPAEFTTTSHGSAYDLTDLSAGEQELAVTVPAELQPGACEVLVEVDGRRSKPLPLLIAPASTAPTLKSIRPPTPRPKELIWIDGTGFSASDEVQITDSAGETHHIYESGGGTSNANTLAFTVPGNVAAGAAEIRIVEHRSGSKQTSNALSTTIYRGPVPLDVFADWLMPVAPGQWLDLVVGSGDPLKDAERVEVLFRQDGASIIASTVDTTVAGLKVQVPKVLKSGIVTLQTRTVVKGEPSDWSKPVDFRLLAEPAPPKVFGIAVRDVKAQAAARERKRTGETTDDDPIRVQVYLGPETKQMTVYAGEELHVDGTFPVASADEVECFLQRETMTLQLEVAAENPHRLKVTVPEDSVPGNYELVLVLKPNSATVKLPLTLTIRRSN